jgi:hypothetical protein
LLCYKLSFQPTGLSNGAILDSSTTLGELFNQVQVARSSTLADQRMLANLLEMLNGDDPSARCNR